MNLEETHLNISMFILHNLTQQFLVNRNIRILLGQSCVSLMDLKKNKYINVKSPII